MMYNVRIIMWWSWLRKFSGQNLNDNCGAVVVQKICKYAYFCVKKYIFPSQHNAVICWFFWFIYFVKCTLNYRSGTVNSNTVNSKFHLIRSYCEIFFYNFPNISCLKYTVSSNFHLIRSKTLPTNDLELTVSDLYQYPLHFLLSRF